MGFFDDYKSPVNVDVLGTANSMPGSTGVLGWIRHPAEAYGLTAFTDSFKEETGKFPAMYQQERAKQTQDALFDRTVDTVTKNEISALYSSGATLDQISTLIASAKEGKGIYAVRKVNYANQLIQQDMPGRVQLAAIKPGQSATNQSAG